MIAFARSVKVDDLVGALLGYAPRAVIPAGNLAAMLGVEEPAIIEAARNAEADDRAVYWEKISSVVLGMTEAECQGLELRCPLDAEIDPKGWKWFPAGKVPPDRPKHSVGFGGDWEIALTVPTTHHFPDVEDPRFHQWLRGEVKATAGRKGDGYKRPWRELDDFLERSALESTPRVKTIGTAAAWSPALEVVKNPKCVLCGGHRLDLLAYCLGCSRSGLDGLLPEVKDEKRRRVLPDKADGLAGGMGRKVG